MSVAASPIRTDLDAMVARVAEIDRRLAAVLDVHQRCAGEEHVLVGAAAALQPGDWAFWGRQVLVPALFRGLPLATLFRRRLSPDPAVSAEIAKLKIVVDAHGPAARLPHATGLAWAARKDGIAALAELGDGAVSDADFHVGLNFAAVWGAPVVFVVRSEGITAVSERAEGYGMRSAVVDGDAEAVRAVVAEHLAKARAGEGPALIEAAVQRGRAVSKQWTSAHETEVEAALAAAEREAQR